MESKKVLPPIDMDQAGHLLPACCKIAFEIIHKKLEDSRNKRIIKTTRKPDGTAYTRIDLEAQNEIIKTIKNSFPFAGILAEEGVSTLCTDPSGVQYYFIIDAMDGSSQLEWNNINNVGVILSFMYDGKIVAAAVGELARGQIHTVLYNKKKPRISTILQSMPKYKKAIAQNANTLLKDHKVRLRTHPMNYFSTVVDRLCMPKKIGGAFYDIGVIGGGISVSFIELWMSTYGGLILPAKERGLTPWDWQAIYYISKAYGYVHFLLPPGNFKEKPFEEVFELFNPEATLELTPQPYPLLVIHKKKVPELRSWHEYIKTT